MPKLTIDNIEVEVPAGTNVLEAAKKVGVVIPHFCYHPALGSVGACRLCAMKFLEGPVKGVQVSCMIQAADGMVVSTTDGEAARLRRMVIEWLMMNHPHDCPVCDEGGMCLLQDYTVAGGHGIRRYKGKKRVFPDQYLGEFIQHEMNRCIQCYRCARFYQDYAGGDDFGPMQIANKVYFGRFRDGWLESPFSGNLADVCPTGVLTDRTFRFKARAWDLETAPSVCPHCSLGCNTVPGGRYRQLLRVVARENQKVNGWFICDRGRFGYGFASHPDRPYHPAVHGAVSSPREALDFAVKGLFEITNAHGGDAVGFLGSPRASVETNFALARLASELRSENVCFHTDPDIAARERLAVSRLTDGISRPLGDISRSDVILAMGVDAVNEAPMLALMMRQAARAGARIFVADPRPVELPFEFTHIATPLSALADKLPEEAEAALKEAKRPTVLTSTALGAPGLIELAADTAVKLREAGADSGLFVAMSGPNSFGAALMQDGPDFSQVLEEIERGRVKALIVVESDPVGLYPDPKRARTALDKLEMLIVLDHLPTATAEKAHVFIPTPAYAEDDGIYVNNEGRAQAFAKAYTAGVPINSMGPDAHPPREFFADVPGGTPPAWETLIELSCMLVPECPVVKGVSALRSAIADSDPVWGALAAVEPGTEGAVLQTQGVMANITVSDAMPTGGQGLLLVAVDRTFGTEELSSYSGKTELRSPGRYVMLHNSDAEALGLAGGQTVAVGHGASSYECELIISANMAPGHAFVPRLRGWKAWEFSGKRVTVRAK